LNARPVEVMSALDSFALALHFNDALTTPEGRFSKIAVITLSKGPAPSSGKAVMMHLGAGVTVGMVVTVGVGVVVALAVGVTVAS
jgi:hypothetical protein